MTVLSLDDLTVPAPDPGPADWNDMGVRMLPRFLTESQIDYYMAEWGRANGCTLNPSATDLMYEAPRIIGDRAGGWPDATPYMRHPALRALCCDGWLAAVLEELLGEPAGVHLNLTGWVTTERDWHQDSYLNPPEVGDAYAAVWFALGDIHPDSGPFQFVPGSHRWPQVTRDLIGRHVDLSNPAWPKHSEMILSPLFEREIEHRGAEVVTYLPQRGDVLIWHGRLLHRGSRANLPGAYRPALIAHYSGVYHRPDMPPALQHANGGWLFPLGGTQPVR